MIKVKKTDNIFDVIYKIEKSKNTKKIILNIPFGHNILRDFFALKSLKERFPKQKIIINTTDIASKKIGKPLGIKYSIIKEKSNLEDSSANLIKYNYGFFEYFKYEIKKIFGEIVFFFKKQKKKPNGNLYYKKFIKQKSNIGLFFSLLIISIFIFLYIFYFALNKTYVYITPDIKVQTKSKNFIFKELISTGTILKTNEEKLLKIEKEVFLEKEFSTSGIKQDEKYRASGEVKFINKSFEKVKLKPKTRIISKSGIVYETIGWVGVPAAVKNKQGKIIFGEKKAKVKAKLKDINGVFVGKRGNLTKTGAIFYIPGLKNTNIEMYAQNTSFLLGGKDKYTKILQKKDLENSQKILIEELKKQAITEIHKEIEKINDSNNVVFKKISGEDMYKFYDIKINLPKNLKPGDKLDKFKLNGSLKVYSFAYNTNSVISKLKKEIEQSIIPQKEKILFINDKSIRVTNILYKNQKPFYMKATISIEIFLAYNFENQNDNYIKRLKQTIAGLDKKQAEKILINEAKISNVKIEIRPFFLEKVSSFFDNIKFIIE